VTLGEQMTMAESRPEVTSTRRSIHQQVENRILQPTLVGRAAQVAGLAVLVGVPAFETLFGAIAVPPAAREHTAARRARLAAERGT
jgi:hypothetical protein